MPRDASVTRAEREARKRVEALGIDVDAYAAVSNIFRVANAVRNYTERNLLSEFNLTFSGFTVLWVLWVWGPKESYALAEESGISKSTLTGVVKTLERLGLATPPAPRVGRPAGAGAGDPQGDDRHAQDLPALQRDRGTGDPGSVVRGEGEPGPHAPHHAPQRGRLREGLREG